MSSPPLKASAAAESVWVDSALMGLAMSTALHKNKTTVADLDGEAQPGTFLVRESRGVEQHTAETGRSAARSPLHSLAVPTHLLSLHFPVPLVGTHI